MTVDRAALRKAFPDDLIGKLPKITCKACSDKKQTCQEHRKSKCQVCGNYITQAHMHVDYVGHAAVTDRLLQVDPEWTYTVDHEMGGGEGFVLRGTMTVGGVSRVEYGEGKNPKEALSDFVKRGAMRFGVALDLWSKEELQASEPPSSGVGSDPGESTDGIGAHPASPTVATAGPNEPASPETSAPVGLQEADAAAPPSDPRSLSDTDSGEGATRSDGNADGGAAPKPCIYCGAGEFDRLPTPSGRIQLVCKGCRKPQPKLVAV